MYAQREHHGQHAPPRGGLPPPGQLRPPLLIELLLLFLKRVVDILDERLLCKMVVRVDELLYELGVFLADRRRAVVDEVLWVVRVVLGQVGSAGARPGARAGAGRGFGAEEGDTDVARGGPGHRCEPG